MVVSESKREVILLPPPMDLPDSTCFAKVAGCVVDNWAGFIVQGGFSKVISGDVIYLYIFFQGLI
jgi:hypothetical protein